jgi:hypothetical protein
MYILLRENGHSSATSPQNKGTKIFKQDRGKDNKALKDHCRLEYIMAAAFQLKAMPICPCSSSWTRMATMHVGEKVRLYLTMPHDRDDEAAELPMVFLLHKTIRASPCSH